MLDGGSGCKEVLSQICLLGGSSGSTLSMDLRRPRLSVWKMMRARIRTLSVGQKRGDTFLKISRKGRREGSNNQRDMQVQWERLGQWKRGRG